MSRTYRYVFFEGRARYEMGATTAALQERKWKDAYRRFYLRPHRVAMTLARRTTWQHLPRTIGMAVKVIFQKKTKGEHVWQLIDQANAA